ncbi:hypothetical protein WJX73_007231 [Symbiochloris irregularis]|uniref:Protein kinase domain-containing protein n=1 Tax=Symbiochloris irregularis TaxID=706552 RepID=A0AAW1PMX0_9CHLO
MGNNVSSQSSQLIDAAARGDVQSLPTLVANTDIDSQDEEGWCALHAAAFNGQLEVLDWLLQHKALVDVPDKEGRTSLHLAALSGQVGAVDSLCVKGADLKLWDRDGLTPLHKAAAQGHLATVEKLLLHGSQPSKLSKGGFAAAHLAACKGHTEVLVCLLDRGVHPGATTLDGWTLLHEAAAGGHVDAVRLLLQRGADPDALDSQRKTPRQLAQAKGHKAVLAILPGAHKQATQQRAGKASTTESADVRPDDTSDTGTSPLDMAESSLARIRLSPTLKESEAEPSTEEAAPAEEQPEAKQQRLGPSSLGTSFSGFMEGHGAVVIKRLHEGVAPVGREFEAAAALLASLRHAHIVRLLGYGMCGSHCCLVFPRFQLGSLDDSLRFRRLPTADGRPGVFIRLEWGDRLRAALHAARGLGYLHSHSPQQLAHGAVQPSNVLIAEDDQGRKAFHLADSCLGVIAQQAESRGAYQDPSLDPSAGPSAQGDIYALGQTMLQLLTGLEAHLGLHDMVASKMESSGISQVVDPCTKGWPDDNATRFAQLAIRCCAPSHVRQVGADDIIMQLEGLAAAADS